MATASESRTVTSFPLERPSLRARRRDASALQAALPYFIAGEENRLVAFVCVARQPIFDLGNPVLLVGNSGVGKTSLALHLAAQQATSEGTGGSPAAVHYMPAIDFARQFADAVASDDMPPLRALIDEAPILVLDDLHLIADKPAAQDELTLRIESRTAARHPTIVTCRRLPSEVRGMRPMLVSRVLPGLTIPVKSPAGEARTMLLREFALHHDLELDDDLLDSLVSRLDPSLPTRSLEAIVKQMTLWCRMNDSPPTIEAVKAATELIGRSDDVSLSSITNAVSRYFRQKPTELRSGSRKQRIVRARSLAMLLARRMTSKSMHQIGEYFGGRDHTTVLHAIRKTEALLEEDTDLRRAAEEVTEKLSA